MERALSPLLLLSLLFFATLTVVLGKKSDGFSADRTAYLNPPPEYIEHFHFGFAGSMADSLWLRWIQDGHECQVYGERDPETAKSQGSEGMAPRHRVCDNSWSFKMLDAVTKLDPKFQTVYFLGAMSLAVVVEDYKGATVLFDRGVKALPTDWPILYRAAYHYIFDLDDPKRGAELLLQAADNGGPAWFRGLAARLYSRAGQIDLGIATLENFMSTQKDKKVIEYLQSRIEKLKSQKAAAGKE